MNQTSTDVDTAISTYKKEMDEQTTYLKELRNSVTPLSEDVTSLKVLVNLLSRTGSVVTRMNVAACKLLEEEINNLVPDASVYEVRVIPGKSIVIESRFNGNKWVSTNGQSGGERRLTDILTTIAISNLFADKYNLPNGVLGLSIFDEMFCFLDASYGELAYNALRMMSSKLKIVMTHDQNIQPFFSSVIKVNKENGCSQYVM